MWSGSYEVYTLGPGDCEGWVGGSYLAGWSPLLAAAPPWLVRPKGPHTPWVLSMAWAMAAIMDWLKGRALRPRLLTVPKLLLPPKLLLALAWPWLPPLWSHSPHQHLPSHTCNTKGTTFWQCPETLPITIIFYLRSISMPYTGVW